MVQNCQFPVWANVRVLNITKKDDKAMVMHVGKEERLKVKFYKQVGVELL